MEPVSSFLVFDKRICTAGSSLSSVVVVVVMLKEIVLSLSLPINLLTCLALFCNQSKSKVLVKLVHQCVKRWISLHFCGCFYRVLCFMPSRNSFELASRTMTEAVLHIPR